MRRGAQLQRGPCTHSLHWGLSSKISFLGFVSGGTNMEFEELVFMDVCQGGWLPAGSGGSVVCDAMQFALHAPAILAEHSK